VDRKRKMEEDLMYYGKLKDDVKEMMEWIRKVENVL
jgi:hypothetical protein